MCSTPVLIDPATLAFTPFNNKDELVQKVTFLATWARLARESRVKVTVPPDARGFLERNSFFPAHDAVASAIDSLGMRYRYAPQDLIGPINTVLSHAQGVLYCCAKDEDHEDFVSVPAGPWHAQADLNNQSHRAVLLGKIEQLLHSTPPHLLFACLIQEVVVEFSASLTIVEPDSLPGFSSGDLPRVVSGVLRVVSDYESILDIETADELWARSDDNVKVKQAIQLRCREKLKSSGLYKTFAELPEFYVGPEFFGSLARHQATGTGRFASVTLEACACALLELENFEWHTFNKARRKADNAEPLRAHLTTGSMAMRLMAWRRPGARNSTRIEFSNVGPKWEEEICNTDPNSAV
jgi:hypothetical protein